VFEDLRLEIPNVSGRMDNLRAAVLRPQIGLLRDRRDRWAALYRGMEAGLAGVPGLHLVARADDEVYMGSSFQFLLPDWEEARIVALLAACAGRGVELKWFGAGDPVAFTSRYDHWRYAGAQSCPVTDRILAGLVDMRLPLTFSVDDVGQIARIIRAEALRIGQAEVVEAVAAPQVQ
jgi:dTDP-4-amino-4,6-dideoxygalactose transaminase